MSKLRIISPSTFHRRAKTSPALPAGLIYQLGIITISLILLRDQLRVARTLQVLVSLLGAPLGFGLAVGVRAQGLDGLAQTHRLGACPGWAG